MLIAEVMTSRPIAVTPEMTVAEAARRMLEHRISGLPVVDDAGALIGIVTEGDLLRRAETGTEKHRPRWLELLLPSGRLAADYIEAHARRVSEVMTTDVISAAPDTPLEGAVQEMEKHRIKRLPVVEDGKLVGIVSRADLVRVLLRKLTDEANRGASHPLTDAEIRDRIVDVIDKQPWGPRFSVTVTVKDGVVDFHGTITDDRERTALTVAAENVPGVQGVRDHLVWVEPTSGMVISRDAGVTY
jgi:CBS domain-containing protein